MICERTIVGGCVVQDEFIDLATCAKLIDQVNRYRGLHDVPVIERTDGELPLKYAVIDGEHIAEFLPQVLDLYERATRLVKKLRRRDIEPLADRKVACNINTTQPGGSYRYHYDRNAVTAIVYLNETDGGETECYPNYRLPLATATPSRLQQTLDRALQNRFVRAVAATQLLVRPRAGRLLIMEGNRCLHSVRPVVGETDRVNIIMSYDRPGACFPVAADLNSYLYSKTDHGHDPNYLR